jgi:vitamin K-dependent gamma-carboxylase
MDVQKRAFTAVDIASLNFFRIAFGLLMVWEVGRYFHYGWIATYWIEPRFLFKYYGFSWVQPWPGNGLYIHWAALGVLALFIAVGLLYRVSATLFFLGYTYAFLLDESRWLNHTYLICLFSFLLIFMPANRALSVDAWLRPRLRSDTTPAWTLWLLRVQMGVVYFFSGVAKFSPDWLHGEPMRMWMAQRIDFPILGRFFRDAWIVYTMSYGAMLLDLFIVPLLLWRRTRGAAFCVALVFHLLNSKLFADLGVFPWLAIAATTLFFPPDWPRRIVSIFRPVTTSPFSDTGRLPNRWKRVVVLSFVAIYTGIQVLLPLRHLLYRGGIEWTYEEHRFSWRMMLLDRYTRGFFYVTDPNTRKTYQVSSLDYLTQKQVVRMEYRPDMLLQFAHYLATVMPRKGPKPLKVEARVFISINGRKPQLLLDPNVDLAAEPQYLGRPRWLLRIDESLPPDGKYFSTAASAPRAEGNNIETF